MLDLKTYLQFLNDQWCTVVYNPIGRTSDTLYAIQSFQGETIFIFMDFFNCKVLLLKTFLHKTTLA